MALDFVCSARSGQHSGYSRPVKYLPTRRIFIHESAALISVWRWQSGSVPSRAKELLGSRRGAVSVLLKINSHLKQSFVCLKCFTRRGSGCAADSDSHSQLDRAEGLARHIRDPADVVVWWLGWERLRCAQNGQECWLCCCVQNCKERRAVHHSACFSGGLDASGSPFASLQSRPSSPVATPSVSSHSWSPFKSKIPLLSGRHVIQQ